MFRNLISRDALTHPVLLSFKTIQYVNSLSLNICPFPGKLTPLLGLPEASRKNIKRNTLRYNTLFYLNGFMQCIHSIVSRLHIWLL